MATKKRSTRRARLLAQARAGDAEAQGELGWDLYSKRPVQKRLGVRWWRKAAEAGVAQAQHWLGRCYDEGEGVRRDQKVARIWWERAAAQGWAPSQLNLGVACARGEGGPRDRARANRLYRLAAARGDEIAMHNLGSVYLHGRGVKRSVRRGFEWHRKAADHGDVDSALRILELAHEHGFALERGRVARWLRRAVIRESTETQVRFGAMLCNGEELRRDFAEGLRLYRRAARKDDPHAWFNIGLMHKLGQGVRASWPRALACFGKAARLGHPRAAWQVYEFLDEAAEDETRDLLAIRKAISSLKRSAARGERSALCMLGQVYHNGDCVKPDQARAARLYRRSADLGEPYAMYLLGLCYRDGEGVACSLPRARRWFAKAAGADPDEERETVLDARKALAELGREKQRR